MTDTAGWWQRPRTVTVVVDNPGWVVPWAENLVREAATRGDHARLVHSYGDVGSGGIAFYLGCMTITPTETLNRNHRNLVVHASDLPKGRGFSPWAWQILEGANEIPVCLFEAREECDAGPVIYRQVMALEDHELLGEIRAKLGALHVDLALRFLAEAAPPCGHEQQGDPTQYRRRRPEDSRIDPARPLAEQFELLRIVDNERYPAFFDYRGHRYKLAVDKLTKPDGTP